MGRTRKTPAAADNDYVVMGDLGTGPTGEDGATPELTKKQVRDGDRKYIVRMFIGGIGPDATVYDEEIVAHVEDLDATVTKRMGELAAKPDRKAALPHADTEDGMTLSGQHPGHAIPVPGHAASREALGEIV